METTLKKYGANSQAIVIPKAILKLFKIGPKTKFEFKTNNNRLQIEVKSETDQKFKDSWQEVSQDFSETFKSLATK